MIINESLPEENKLIISLKRVESKREIISMDLNSIEDDDDDGKKRIN